MLGLERRNEILKKLQEEKKVVVGDLSKLYSVSEETIRRDLDKLDKEGLCIKSYGGALLSDATYNDMPTNVRKKSNAKVKKIIANLVAELIEDGDYIMLDASSTSGFIAKAIQYKENLTVLTNSVEILLELADVSGWNIISTGGKLQEGYLALTGPRTLETLDKYKIKKSILSCKGFSIDDGMMESNEDFACIKEKMITIGKQVILAIDSSKFDKAGFIKYGSLDMIDIVVTDKKPDVRFMDLFSEHKIECIYPK
ncbi:DeoR family transcriptional regulator [Candidatus Epulonipiscium fishelsonii]|uniref:DeoR family transcriptional regulator n=1 Tax=Candidatus Epulonipiscium fishelsonii TaxID=77094 RepID=A0ACC8XA95_9FIRM|nr:DeoR family transcriptional regulator [Epulopiscium sp. SCG-B05WGA-EpuloA1]ONI39056.1 DeoR family transcriptional regulator [Epulopiscium sp. SCG-B11WGA-EpuloA1]ONI47535.1 DeoR family transcriptional regulator [Epulopiscium sp. SCG-C06WGA-EpuloA1]